MEQELCYVDCLPNVVDIKVKIDNNVNAIIVNQHRQEYVRNN